MFKYIFSISLYFTIITLVYSQNLEKAFYNYLIDWKINYEELKEHKAGAVCIPVEKNPMEDLMNNLPDLETVPLAEL